MKSFLSPIIPFELRSLANGAMRSLFFSKWFVRHSQKSTSPWIFGLHRTGFCLWVWLATSYDEIPAKYRRAFLDYARLVAILERSSSIYFVRYWKNMTSPPTWV